MRSINLPVCAALAGALLGVARPGHAQAGMYGRDRDRMSRQAQVYLIAVREGVNATLSEWREAWDRDDPEALSRLYVENATLYTDEGAILGRDAIAAYFRRTLPDRSGRRSVPLGFDASGSLAFQIQEATVQVLAGDGTSRARTQRELLVLRQQWDDRWLIQSQLSTEIRVGTAR